MNNRIETYLQKTGPVFCLDVGSGTQDGVLALPNRNFDNWPRWILPSPAFQVARSIEEATRSGTQVFLYGHNMGGGFTEAVQAHIQKGLALYATKSAAQAIHDNPDRVQAMGVRLCESCPSQAKPIHLSDYSQEFWHAHFRSLHLPTPSQTVASAQDHGYCLTGNRTFRMTIWENLLKTSPDLSSWIYTKVPDALTRLSALQQETGGPVADTGCSALLAFLCDPALVARSYREGITLINAGNTHVIAALLYKEKICGIYEHHTALLDKETLERDLRDFRLGWLPKEQVQQALGHGTVYGERPEEAGGFEASYMTGPMRDKFAGLARFSNPCGDMMAAGCFGLLHGIARKD